MPLPEDAGKTRGPPTTGSGMTLDGMRGSVYVPTGSRVECFYVAAGTG